jgi:hypothetical protein
MRCQKILTALRFFNREIAKYTASILRGVGKGIISYEVATAATTALTNLATYIAPELTASIYAGATSIIVPIALTGATLCGIVLMGQLTDLGYLYATDQLKFQQELRRIQKFAQQFYNFDQAPQAHVENIAHCATTFAWPFQRQNLWNSLMGMHKVCCNLYLHSGQIIQRSGTITTEQLDRALKIIKNNELTRFKVHVKNIVDTVFFEIHHQEESVLSVAGMDKLVNHAEHAALSNILTNESFDAVDKVSTALIAKIASTQAEKPQELVASEITNKIEEIEKIACQQQLVRIESHVTEDVQKIAESLIAQTIDSTAKEQTTEILFVTGQAFLATEVGRKVKAAAIKEYERKQFSSAENIYDKLLNKNAP